MQISNMKYIKTSVKLLLNNIVKGIDNMTILKFIVCSAIQLFH
jgi:hypothetical protein